MTTASSLPHWRSTLKLSTMIVVALVVLVIAIGGQAKADALFAAIWQGRRTSLSGPAQLNRRAVPAGTRPARRRGLPAYVREWIYGWRGAALRGHWEKDGGPAFQARHNLTGAQFQASIRPARRPGLPRACGKRLCSRRRAALRRHLAEGRRTSLSGPAQLNWRAVPAGIRPARRRGLPAYVREWIYGWRGAALRGHLGKRTADQPFRPGTT